MPEQPRLAKCDGALEFLFPDRECDKYNSKAKLIFIVDSLPFRQHALVQDARNENAFSVLTVKYNMPSALHSPQAGTDIITISAKRRIAGHYPAARLKIVEVTDGLVFAPGAKRISGDA